MATIVYQGLHSCLEPQILEPPRTTLRLKLAPPKSAPSTTSTTISNNSDKNPNFSAWNFFQSISNSTHDSPPIDKQNPYLHFLNSKSLELCTENLGNETGTDDIIQSNIFSEALNLNLNSSRRNEEERTKSRQVSGKRKVNNCREFPPPLTTISGTESILVRPHRENGRLIIDAVKAPSMHSYFQTERRDGRLRLSVWRDCEERFDCEENEGISVDCESKDMEGNSLKDGGEIGIDEFHRPRRCNEGDGNGLLIWEPFLVATS